jgi:hypothetical protein
MFQVSRVGVRGGNSCIRIQQKGAGHSGTGSVTQDRMESMLRFGYPMAVLQYVYYFNQNLDLLTFHVQERTELLSPDFCTTLRGSESD